MAEFSISGDWTEIAPGVRVRLQDAPNEEDMEFYEPHGIVILQVERELGALMLAEHQGQARMVPMGPL